jgi:hypothetical protein
MKLSAKSNIEILSALFDCGFKPDAVLLGSHGGELLKDSLLQCDLLKNTSEREIAVMVERIRHCVPVGCSSMEVTLPRLFHTLRPESISTISAKM